MTARMGHIEAPALERKAIEVCNSLGLMSGHSKRLIMGELVKQRVADRVKSRREFLLKKQIEFGPKSRSAYLSRVERALSLPSKEFLKKLAVFLDCSPEYFWEDGGEK